MNRRIDGEGETGMTVGSGSKGQVRQGKEGTSLTDTPAIEVFGTNLHTGFGVAVAHFEQRHACQYCKLIAL